jgi:hypothetical protein
MLNPNIMLESDKMGAMCALSVGNHQFDATVKVRQNVRVLVSANFDQYTTLPSGPHPTLCR